MAGWQVLRCAAASLGQEYILEAISGDCIDWSDLLWDLARQLPSCVRIPLPRFKSPPPPAKPPANSLTESPCSLSNSFPGETLIHTESGLKPIAEIKEGERVKAYAECVIR